MPNAELLYSTQEAADLIACSKAAIRSYTTKFARYLSTDATPPAGQPRRFSATDLRTLHFIYTHASAGRTHDAIEPLLADNDSLAAHPWQTPDATPSAKPGPASPTTALTTTPADDSRLDTLLRTLAGLMAPGGGRHPDDIQRIAELERRLAEQQQRIETLQLDLGVARGRLAALTEQQSTHWWHGWLGKKPPPA